MSRGIFEVVSLDVQDGIDHLEVLARESGADQIREDDMHARLCDVMRCIHFHPPFPNVTGFIYQGFPPVHQRFALVDSPLQNTLPSRKKEFGLSDRIARQNYQ